MKDAAVGDTPVGTPPDWLEDAGKTMWQLIVDSLGKNLQPVDRGALIITCASYGACEVALRNLNERGPLVAGRGKHPDENGDDAPVKNPANQVAREQAVIFKQMCAEFGLTPAARKRIAFEAKKESDGAEGLID